jgi:hypothetical protein
MDLRIESVKCECYTNCQEENLPTEPAVEKDETPTKRRLPFDVATATALVVGILTLLAGTLSFSVFQHGGIPSATMI